MAAADQAWNAPFPRDMQKDPDVDDSSSHAVLSMSQATEDAKLTELACQAQDGDPRASWEVVELIGRLASAWLKQNGVRCAEDIEELCQDVAFDFFRRWDRSRSSAGRFLYGILLPARRAAFFREVYRRAPAAPSSNRLEQEAAAPPDDYHGTTGDVEYIERMLRARTLFLSPLDREVVQLRLAHPTWKAKQIAEAVGLGEASVSLVLRQKLPLEMMNWWAEAAGPEADDCLPNLAERVQLWQREGDLSLASQGLQLLLWGFSKPNQDRGLHIVGLDGEPYVLKFLIQRAQVALTEQELGEADASLARVERLIRSPDVPDAARWQHRLLYVRGRRQTAEFRYDAAIEQYHRVFKEVPRACWEGDPTFLHSLAVAYRGVGAFQRAVAFMEQSLETYGIQDRPLDVAHTKSRLARVNIEEGESRRRAMPLETAEGILSAFTQNHPRFKLLNPLGHTQNLLHRLRLYALLHRHDEEILPLVDEASVLINQGNYAHEFLELEEVILKYGLAERLKDKLKLDYKPRRARFGLKKLRAIRRRMVQTRQ